MRWGRPDIPCRSWTAFMGTTKPRFRKDLLDRKMSFANGVGTVHGDQYELDGWGLA